MTEPEAAPRPPRWFTLLFGSGVLPLVAVAALVLVLPTLPSAWRGATGDGMHGTFTVTDEDCGKGGCSYTGDFVSTDGQRRMSHTLLQGGRQEVGDRVPTVFTGRDHEVYRPGNRSTFFIGAFAVFAAAAYLIGWTAWLTDKFRSRRRHGVPVERGDTTNG